MNIIMSRAFQQQYPQRTPPPISTPSSPLDFTDRIPFSEIRLSNETLGSGSFGTVFKGWWRGRHVAVKQFKTREEIDSFLVEVKQLSCVNHPNIVTLYGASSLTDTAYLIMEYAEGGSLNHLLHECKQQQQYDLKHACSWAMQTARGVAYLHGIRPKPIMHRDLKPANLLLFKRGSTLKICDFGTACTVKTQMTNNTGSASYMAPEVFATSSYLESGDVFSWSIIFWEILARQHPYAQQYSNPYQILWCVKQEGIRPTKLEGCPKIIWKLITRSWNKDPKKRPSMREIADEMAFIFSLADDRPNHKTNNTPSKSTTPLENNAVQQVKSSNSQLFPICTHFNQELGHRSYLQHDQHHTSPLAEERGHQQSFSNSTKSSSDKRDLSKRKYRALSERLKRLQKRARELEDTDACVTSWELVEELDKNKCNMKQLQSRQLLLPKTFNHRDQFSGEQKAIMDM